MPWRKDKAITEMKARVKDGRARKKTLWMDELNRSVTAKPVAEKLWIEPEKKSNLNPDGTIPWDNL